MEKDMPPAYVATSGAPNPGFYPPPPVEQAPGATVVITGAAPTVVGALGPEPQLLTCPHCHNQISSKVEVEPNTKTHLFALLLCAFGCWPCVCVPYYVDSCQSRNHYCPHCSAYLGAYSD